MGVARCLDGRGRNRDVVRDVPRGGYRLLALSLSFRQAPLSGLRRLNNASRETGLVTGIRPFQRGHVPSPFRRPRWRNWLASSAPASRDEHVTVRGAGWQRVPASVLSGVLSRHLWLFVRPSPGALSRLRQGTCKSRVPPTPEAERVACLAHIRRHGNPARSLDRLGRHDLGGEQSIERDMKLPRGKATQPLA